MSLLIGKNWFRDNINPYLIKIKAEIANSSGGGGGNPPLIYEFTPNSFAIGSVTNIEAVGEFFTPSTVLSCSTATITNYTFTDQQHCTFDITSATVQTNEIKFTGGGGFAVKDLDSAVVAASTWIDLRSSSTDTFNVAVRSGTSLVRDNNGISTTGSLWSAWFKIDSHSWLRSQMKRVSFIFRNTGACMTGIFGSDQNENGSAQYYEAEIENYHNSGTNTYGWYGTNAAHSGASAADAITRTNNNWYRVEYDNNGQAGEEMRMYDMGNAIVNLNDTGTLIKTVNIPSNFTANSTTLFVGAIAISNNMRMMAFKLEDM